MTNRPIAAVTDGLTQLELLRITERKWQVTEGVTGLPDEKIQDLRRHADALEAHGSEFSHGPGTEPEWVTQRAAQHYQLATPQTGGRYHGLAPPWWVGPGQIGPPCEPLPYDPRGSQRLVQALHRNG